MAASKDQKRQKDEIAMVRTLMHELRHYAKGKVLPSEDNSKSIARVALSNLERLDVKDLRVDRFFSEIEASVVVLKSPPSASSEFMTMYDALSEFAADTLKLDLDRFNSSTLMCQRGEGKKHMDDYSNQWDQLMTQEMTSKKGGFKDIDAVEFSVCLKLLAQMYPKERKTAKSMFSKVSDPHRNAVKNSFLRLSEKGARKDVEFVLSILRSRLCSVDSTKEVPLNSKIAAFVNVAAEKSINYKEYRTERINAAAINDRIREVKEEAKENQKPGGRRPST